MYCMHIGKFFFLLLSLLCQHVIYNHSDSAGLHLPLQLEMWSCGPYVFYRLAFRAAEKKRHLARLVTGEMC